MELGAVLVDLRLDLLGRLLLAVVLGGVIGLERELSDKPAGFRTNILICVGAALLTELSVAVAGRAPAGAGDPTRIAAQIVSGIGFLGAGTIMQARGSVIGLTTAATLWVVAAIGIAVGSGAYVEAVGTTGLVILALVGLGRVESLVTRRRSETTFNLVLEPHEGGVEAVVAMLRQRGLKVELEEVQRDDEQHRADVRVHGRGVNVSDLMNAILEVPGVRGVRRKV